MKFLMLCREPRLYSCQRLKQAAEQRGYQMDILDPNRCILRLSPNAPHFVLLYQDSAHAPVRPLSDYAAVLPRFGTTSTEMGCAVLNALQSQGVPCLNNAQAFALARDKWASLQHLAQHGIAIPTSQRAGCEVNAKTAQQQMGAPCVLKTLSGSQGVGVMLAESAASAQSILETLAQANLPVLQQQFIAEAQSADIRCFVIGERVVAAMQRQGQQGEFRANFHRGGSAQKIELSHAEQQLAINASQALGLDVAGVDLIRSAQGTLVLEVNASPGLELIEQTSGEDIAGLMIEHIEKLLVN